MARLTTSCQALLLIPLRAFPLPHLLSSWTLRGCGSPAGLEPRHGLSLEPMTELRLPLIPMKLPLQFFKLSTSELGMTFITPSAVVDSLKGQISARAAQLHP